MQATHHLGEMSRRRDFFYLVGTWESDNKYSKRYSSWFLSCSCSRELRFNWKKSCFFLCNIYSIVYCKKHNQNSSWFISVWLCTLYWEYVYCSCLLGFSSISPGFQLLSQILCLWVKIVAIAYQAETLWGNILSCWIVMKTTKVVGKLSMLVWYQNDGFIWLLYNMFWKAVVLLRVNTSHTALTMRQENLLSE